MGSDGRLPWFKFEPARWLGDLRVCSWGAKGVWSDLQSFMAQSREFGFLLVGARAATNREIARMLGGDPRAALRFMEELEEKGVLRRDDRGAVFSTELLRICAISQRNVANGLQGGNPMLLENNPLDQNSVNPPVKADSDSDSESTENRGASPPSPLGCASGAGGAAPAEEANDARQASAFDPGGPLGHLSHAGGNVVPLRPRGPEPAPRPGDPALSTGEPGGPPEPAGPVATPAAAAKATADEVAGRAAQDAAFDAWNQVATASGWMRPAVQLGDDQRAKLRRRLIECGGIAGFRKVLTALEGSDLWMGRLGRRWHPVLDDLLSPAKFRRAREGGYDSTPSASAGLAVPVERRAPQRPGPFDHMFPASYIARRRGQGPMIEADPEAEEAVR